MASLQQDLLSILRNMMNGLLPAVEWATLTSTEAKGEQVNKQTQTFLSADILVCKLLIFFEKKKRPVLAKNH